MTCLSPKALARLESGGLDETAASEARSHLDECPPCRERREELTQVLSVLGSGLEEGEPEPAPGTWAAIAETLERDADRVKIARVVIGCAYCKGALPRAESVYCAACLAPHHEDCFSGHGRCAACAATALVRSERPKPPRRPRPRLKRAIAVAVAGVTLAATGVALGKGYFGSYVRREFLALWVDTQTKRELEWDQLGVEVEKVKSEALHCLAVSKLELERANRAGALEAVASGLGVLDGLPDTAARYREYHTADELRVRLESFAAELAPCYVDLFLAKARAVEEESGPKAVAEAQAALRAALEKAQGALVARVRLEFAIFFRKTGEPERALLELGSILDAEPKNATALLVRGDILAAKGELRRAIADWSNVGDNKPEWKRALMARGNAFLDLHLYEKAAADFEAVIAHADQAPAAFLGRARARLALGDPAGAIDDATEAIDDQPSSPEGYLCRGRIYAAERKFAEAIKDLEVALTRNEHEQAAWLELGRAREAVLEDDGALTAYGSVLGDAQARSQDRAAALVAKARLLLRRAEGTTPAREVLGRARDERRSYAPRLGANELAPRAAVERKARLTEARALLDEATRIDPSSAAALAARGRLAIEAGDRSSALADLEAAERALAERPWIAQAEQGRDRPREPDHDLAEVESSLGRLALAEKDVDGASRHFEAAVAADPNAPLAHVGLALVALEGGADERSTAERELARARYLATPGGAPTEPASILKLASILEDAGKLAQSALRSRKPANYDQACLAFGLALEEDPLDAPALLERARLEEAWGDADLAVQDASAAIAADPLAGEAYELRGRIEWLELPTRRREFDSSELTDLNRAVELARGASGTCALLTRARVLVEGGKLEAARSDLGNAWLELGALSDGSLAESSAETIVRARSIAELRASVAARLGDASASQAQADVRRIERIVGEAAKKALEDGRGLRDKRNYSDAIAKFDRAIALDPTLADGYYDRGTCYLKIGNFVPGILDFSCALELNPRFADQFYNKVYQVSYVTDLNRVIIELNKIVADHPNLSHVIFLRGFFYVAKTEFKKYDRNDLEAGVADFDRTLELNPNHVTAYIYRGFLLYKAALMSEGGDRKKAFDRAMADYRIAVDRDPDSGVAHFLMAMCWSVLSQEKGLDEAEKKARLDKSYEELRVAIDEKQFKGFDRIKSEKGFEAVRDDPRVQKLIRGR
jgi:Tfp pilus assembly protein PilF